MKIKAILILVGIAASLIATSAPGAAPAPEKKKTAESQSPTPAAPAKPAAADARRDHYPLRGELVSVSATQLVLKSAKSKPERKFDITGDTKITKDERPATVKDAKEGQQVTGYVHKTEKGNPRLVSLNLSPKQK